MRKLILIFLYAVVASCSKMETSAPDAMFEAPVITGYKLMDINASSLGKVGNPNVKTEMNSGGVLYRMVVYPIPAINFIALHIDTPKDGTDRQIWIKSMV